MLHRQCCNIFLFFGKPAFLLVEYIPKNNKSNTNSWQLIAVHKYNFIMTRKQNLALVR